MTISLRNLPVALERAILEKSRRDGLSLNKAVIQLLEQAIEPARKNTDFDEFAGSWPAETAAEFEKTLADMRRVDPADWER
jgi:hypothetical protein